ncbi:hypothetical protein AB0F81_27715 [Actinoplanes sp. NPDC024001]|uniref:hypothetical protein n=1 Tax=Actinoplanes sp. NPDC024001 TaxID=3154598 RepID=UPI0033CBB362
MNEIPTQGEHRRRRPWLVIASAAAAVVVVAAGAVAYQRSSDEPTVTAGETTTATPEPVLAGSPSPAGPAAATSSATPAASASAAPSASSARPSAKPKASSSAPARPTGGGGGGCALPAYPTASCTGVPAGWSPRKTVNELTISKAGTTIENYLVKGSITVKAKNVTIRNTRVYGNINNFIGDQIYGPLTMTNVELVNPPGETFTNDSESAIGVADYTCRRCKIINRIEGFRTGGTGYAGAGPVVIEDSFIQLAVPPGMCAAEDPHGDGVQAFGGPPTTIRHNTIDQRLDDCPTAPIFIPDQQSNSGGIVDDNLLAGGSYSLRLMGGNYSSVSGNKIVHGTPGYGPVDVACDRIQDWSDNAVVKYDWATGTIQKEVSKLKQCG